MIELVLWTYLGSLLLAWIILYLIEVQSFKLARMNPAHESSQHPEVVIWTSKVKIAFLSLSLITSASISYLLHWLNSIMTPNCSDISYMLNSSLAIWMLPGVVLGCTFSSFIIALNAAATPGPEGEHSNQSNSKSKDGFLGERFSRRLVTVVTCITVIPIIMWMNLYVIVCGNVVLIKTGLPFLEKQYSVSDVSTIRKMQGCKGTDTKNSMKSGFVVTFKDGYSIHLDEEFSFASKHVKSKLIECLSRKSQIKVETPN